MSAPTVELPSGLVTFLFTDIEGSTRLLHHLGDRYVEVLERHRALIRDACSERGGVVVSESGDSEFVAFSTARDAITASSVAQRELAAIEWPDGVHLRVRMGLHTGTAWPHDGNYVALTVHQAARIMAAAHGGQTLASDAAADALDDSDRSNLAFLGRYRLRDFDSPVGLHQVEDGTTISSFPAVRALPADRHNIVRRPTETVGRDSIIDEIVSSLAAGSLITLTGPGGVGKSRVAAEVGTRAAASWSDGVWLTDLASVSDEELVIPAIAEAIGAPRRTDGDRRADMVDHLQDQQAVIILDNCEHLLAACRAAVAALIERYPTVAVLTTSREPLRVPGESIMPVPPLDAPGVDEALDQMLNCSAVQLFIDRAQSALPTFDVDDENVDTVADICRELDGLPLFIELAAANVDVQSPVDILAGLRESVGRLKARDPQVPERHRTVDGVMDWSYQLLSPGERKVFSRLAVFGWSFTLDAAVAAAPDIDDIDVREIVWSLVDRSLVVADLTANDTRYRLLEVIRSYALARLASADREGVALNIASYFLDRLGPWLPAGVAWIGAVADEIDNLRSLISFIPKRDQYVSQELAYVIGRFHDSTHVFSEGIEELTRYVDGLREPTRARSSMLNMLAYLHLRIGQVEVAERLNEQAVSLRAAHGAPDWDDVGVDRTRGEIARRKGELSDAIEIARNTLERELSDRGRSRMLNLLGTTSGALGDFETAYDALLEELELNRSLGYDEFVAVSEGNLAETALRLGDVKRAAMHQQACLELARAQGVAPMVAFSMLLAARLTGSSGDWATAVRLQVRAEDVLDEVGLVLYDDDRAQMDELVASATAALGDQRVATTKAEGHELSISDAVQLSGEILAATASGADR